jgi:hypothetical protein
LSWSGARQNQSGDLNARTNGRLARMGRARTRPLASLLCWHLQNRSGVAGGLDVLLSSQRTRRRIHKGPAAPGPSGILFGVAWRGPLATSSTRLVRKSWRCLRLSTTAVARFWRRHSVDSRDRFCFVAASRRQGTHSKLNLDVVKGCACLSCHVTTCMRHYPIEDEPCEDFQGCSAAWFPFCFPMPPCLHVNSHVLDISLGVSRPR